MRDINHATIKMMDSERLGASIQGIPLIEYRLLKDRKKYGSGVPRLSLRAGFKAIYTALTILDLDPLSFKPRAPANSRLPKWL